MGTTPPDPKRQQTKPTPGRADDYLTHMINADREYHSRTTATPRGLSSYDASGKLKSGAMKLPRASGERLLPKDRDPTPK
jgi:hypothetical protein